MPPLTTDAPTFADAFPETDRRLRDALARLRPSVLVLSTHRDALNDLEHAVSALAMLHRDARAAVDAPPSTLIEMRNWCAAIADALDACGRDVQHAHAALTAPEQTRGAFGDASAIAPSLLLHTVADALPAEPRRRVRRAQRDAAARALDALGRLDPRRLRVVYDEIRQIVTEHRAGRREDLDRVPCADAWGAGIDDTRAKAPAPAEVARRILGAHLAYSAKRMEVLLARARRGSRA